MSATDATFAGSIPTLYEHHLVPLLFEPYALDLVRRLADLERGQLIEVAAGTGAVTRALASALPSAVEIVATDLNEGMLRVAEERARTTLGKRVRWQQADAQQLPFADASADAIVCQFGVMFLPDKAAGFREARRVLRATGRYLFNVWDRLSENPLSEIAVTAVAEYLPRDVPHFYARTPFGYADVSLIRSDLERGGFQRFEIETVRKTATAPSAESAAIGLCQGTPLRNEIAASDLPKATELATEAIRAHYGQGSFEHSMSAHVITAWRS